jgi:FixJ family two-component response regulator
MSALVHADAAPASQKAVVRVIDDDISLRDALSLMLESVGLESRTYESVAQFLAQDLQDRPGCIILDVRLPGISGLEFQSQSDDLGVQLPMVLMTGHSDVPMSVRAMKAGAVDFLPKPFRDQDMIDAVATAIERDRQRRAADGDVAQVRERFAKLSPREQQVLRQVASGKMNKQIAFDLGLSEITVKIYRSSARRKMGARTVADMVRMADAIEPRVS